MSDQEIYRLIQSDYEKGFDALFSKYYRSLVIYASGYTRDGGSAEDVVQTVLYKYLRGRKFESVDPAKIRPYLFMAVRNGAINHLAGRKAVFPPDLLPEPAEEQPDEILYDASLIARIREQIEMLPPRTRTVVEEIMLQRRSYKEVAERHAISVNTVKTLLGHGMKALRAALGDTRFLILFLHFVL